VHDIAYTSPKGGQVPAYLVIPSRPGRHAGVVFVHHGQGNRQVFLEEAVRLAGRGVVSLLIDAPEARPGARPGHRPDPSFDLAERVQGIIDVRRAFDLLASRADVDPQRLAYVGYSLGATLGATLAGVESRPKGFVMMAGFPSLVHANTEAIFFRELLDEPLRKSWVESMSRIDGVHYLGRSKASFLLQFATRDEYISRWDAAAYAEAISGKKAVEWYPTSHFALGDASREARLRWLAELLALAPPSS
jgi:cephalosporin-C deacetylase-like acetyl esterase